MYTAIKFEMKCKLQNIVVRTKSTENSRNKINMDVSTFTVTVALRGYHVCKTTSLKTQVEDKVKVELEMITSLLETNPYAYEIRIKKTSASLI